MISLIGYRCTGKTTLAKVLAGRLGWPWMDADLEIERQAGKSIARIFAEDGEPVFRDLEARVIAELCGRRELVLAAGGGRRCGRRTAGRCARRPGRMADSPAGNDPARMSADAATPAASRPDRTRPAGGNRPIVGPAGTDVSGSGPPDDRHR